MIRAALEVFGFLVVLAALYAGYVYLSAYLEVKHAPRKPMFLCNKHGLIAPEHLISFIGVPACPRCMYDRVTTT